MVNNTRIMGLDFGSKTVGVAVSDLLMLTAQGVEIIRREKPNKLRRTLSRIGELITEYQVDTIVLGLPLNMDGSEGERCIKTREFASMLEARFHLPIIFCDERLTTVEADEIMMESGIVGRLERKKYVDELAAMLILQSYLDEQVNCNKG